MKKADVTRDFINDNAIVFGESVKLITTKSGHSTIPIPPNKLSLKLVSAIFYQIFIFSPNDSPSKTGKYFLFHLKSSFCAQDIQVFVFLFLSTLFQIQKNKWKWNN